MKLCNSRTLARGQIDRCITFLIVVLISVSCGRSKTPSNRFEEMSVRSPSLLEYEYKQGKFDKSFGGSVGELIPWAATMDFYGKYTPSRVPHGLFKAYHLNGPSKALVAVKAKFRNGNLDGTSTFWDEHGKITKQQVFKDDKKISEKTAQPWLDGETDQQPPKGIYTFFTLGTSGYAQDVTIRSQEIHNEQGDLVNTITNGMGWLPLEGDLWKWLAGRAVCMPASPRSQWLLNRRELREGDTVLIENKIRARFHTQRDAMGNEYLHFRDSEDQILSSVYGPVLAWPEKPE